MFPFERNLNATTIFLNNPDSFQLKWNKYISARDAFKENSFQLNSQDLLNLIVLIKEDWIFKEKTRNAIESETIQLKLILILKDYISISGTFDSYFWRTLIKKKDNGDNDGHDDEKKMYQFIYYVLLTLQRLSPNALETHIRPLAKHFGLIRNLSGLWNLAESLVKLKVSNIDPVMEQLRKQYRYLKDLTGLESVYAFEKDHGYTGNALSLISLSLSMGKLDQAVDYLRPSFPQIKDHPKLLMTILNEFANRGRMGEGEDLFRYVYPNGCRDNPKFVATIVKGWKNFRAYDRAEQVIIDHIREGGIMDLPLLTLWIEIKLQRSDWKGIRTMIQMVQRKGIVPDPHYFSILFKYLYKSGRSVREILNTSQHLSQNLKVNGCDLTSVHHAQIVRALLRDGLIEDAIQAVQSGVGGIQGLSSLLFYMVDKRDSTEVETFLRDTTLELNEACFVSIVKIFVKSGRSDDIDSIINAMQSREMNPTKALLALLTDTVLGMQQKYLPPKYILSHALNIVDKIKSYQVIMDDRVLSLIMRIFCHAGYPKQGVQFYDEWVLAGSPTTMPLLEFMVRTCIEANLSLYEIEERLNAVLGFNVTLYSERLLWLMEYEAYKNWKTFGPPLQSIYQRELKKRKLWHKKVTIDFLPTVIGEKGPEIQNGIRKWNWVQPSLFKNSKSNSNSNSTEKIVLPPPSSTSIFSNLNNGVTFGESGPYIKDGVREWRWRTS